ncbi:hypothetical protein RE432_18380 [Pusillimonas sp. SM2304]|uniref:hypothetical protein n=1 Tax=Pusillimonas sp. SM2304 TaxID=3073241 RepID=UPI002876835C|nr:hypothetical protein [Pusillimonas sp. SM2304]MDS1142405.1 hypothetical protein [Pusillimonas sp. SM2304]
MTNDELKAAVAETFAKQGIWVNQHLPLRDLRKKVEEHTGQRKPYKQNQFDFLRDFAGIKREYGPARWVPPFRPMSTRPHPRQADIEAAQPPFMTPKGAIGNGDENTRVWRR